MLGKPTLMMTKPINRVIGKPKEKILSCGATRVMMPKDKLTISSDKIAGMEISTAS
jgi:hypothetical protein